jgi:hypothetical protein
MDMQKIEVFAAAHHRFSLQRRIKWGLEEWTVIDAEFVPIHYRPSFDFQGNHIAHRGNSEAAARQFVADRLAYFASKKLDI